MLIPQEGGIRADSEKMEAWITAGLPEVLSVSFLLLIHCCETVGKPCVTFMNEIILSI